MKVGPDNLHFWKVPGGAGAAGQEAHLEERRVESLENEARHL